MWFHIVCLVIIGTKFTQAQQNDTRTASQRNDNNPIALNTSGTLEPVISPGQQTPIAKHVTPAVSGGGSVSTNESANPQQDQLPILRQQQQSIATDKRVQSKHGGSNIGINVPGNTRLDQRARFVGLPQFVNPQFTMREPPLNKLLIRPMQVTNILKQFPDLPLPNRGKQPSIPNKQLSYLEQAVSNDSTEEPGNKPQENLAAMLPRSTSLRTSNIALSLMKIWNDQIRVPNMPLQFSGQRPPNQQESISTKPLIQEEQGAGNDSSEEPGGSVQEQTVKPPPKRTSFNPQLAMGSAHLNKMLTKPIPSNVIHSPFRGASWRVPQPSSTSELLLQPEQGVSNDSTEEPTSPQQEQVVELPPARTSFNPQFPMDFPQLNKLWARLIQARNQNIPLQFQDLLWRGKQLAVPSAPKSPAEQVAGNDATEESGSPLHNPLTLLAEYSGAANPRAWRNASTAKQIWAKPFHFRNTLLDFWGEQRPVQVPPTVTDPLTQAEPGTGTDSTEEPGSAPQEQLPNLSLSDRGPVSANVLKDALMWNNILARLTSTRASPLFRRPPWPVQHLSGRNIQLMQKLFLDRINKDARSRNIQHPFALAGISGRYSPRYGALNPQMMSRLVEATKLYRLLNPK